MHPKELLNVVPVSHAAMLSYARELLDDAMHTAVDQLALPIRRIAGYQLGWWDQDGRQSAGAAGKYLRPTLAMLSAASIGGTMESVLPAAVAIELAHNFSILHDDVMDQDKLRRNRPSAWVVFGVPSAILAGDALLISAFQSLSTTSSSAGATGAIWLQQALQEMAVGQFSDMDFESRADVQGAECLNMTTAKTAPLFECACKLGALFGGANEEQLERLGRFGRYLGITFQLVDDLLGIWGDPACTGKPVLSDLRRHKKSLPVVAALADGGQASRDFAEIYRHGRTLTEAELHEAAKLIEAAGGRIKVEHELAHWWKIARNEISVSNIETTLLTAFADTTIQRTF